MGLWESRWVEKMQGLPKEWKPWHREWLAEEGSDLPLTWRMEPGFGLLGIAPAGRLSQTIGETHSSGP